MLSLCQAISGVFELLQSGVELGLGFVVTVVTIHVPQASSFSSKELLVPWALSGS